MEIMFAESDEEAEKKYLTHENTDPFPEILPALLNSADISDYVRTTGMIHPFYIEDLKPASYGLKLRGEYIYWLTPEKRIHGWFDKSTDIDTDGDKVFILKQNSIAFVQLEPNFRFPAYLAARFDLKIKHIYQGILLGTGPLVDPGYEGKIYVPLHNLTNNDYKIKISSPFIWMEFTKLSSNSLWNSSQAITSNRTGQYKKFQKSRSKKSLSDYINDAYPNAAIIGTLPGIISQYEARINKTEISVKETVDSANKATTSFNRAILVAMIGIFVTLIFQIVSMHSKTIDYIKEYEKKIFDEHSELIHKDDQNKILMEKLSELEARIKAQEELLKAKKK